MSRTVFLYLIFSLSIFCCGCEEDFKISNQANTPALVINSLLGTDSVIHASVYSNSHLKNNQKSINIHNAEISVLEDEQFIGYLNYNSGIYSNPELKVKANSHYKMIVSHPDYPVTETECESVNKISIENVAFEIYSEKERITFYVDFNDPVDEKNYYMIQLYGGYSPDYYRLEYLSENIAFNGNLQLNNNNRIRNLLHRSLSFSDQTFSDGEASLSFYRLLDDNGQDYNHYKIALYHISEEYYNYEKSFIAIENSSDIPILNQTNLFSNVEPGYGIFATYAVDEKEILLNY